MEPHLWEAVEAVFAEVADLAPERRAARLDALCAARPEVRRQVESLLAAHDRAGGFLEHDDPGAPAGASESTRRAASVAGPFRLLEPIGEGGMGVVYRAERADGEYVQAAAVKILHGAMRSEEARRRFLAERQILADLNHPHIVTLIDGGYTDTGEPYLAMEFVTGVPLTTYCADASLGLEKRLSLFRQVCSAVQHAHQRGVVHRDLKPANILVTAEGEVKVLDFGVAKLLDASSRASGITTAGLHPLTPNYASPEQLRGVATTTASDIYALGVLLYELVAGARPYEMAGRPLDEMLVQVTRRDPPRPSEAPLPDGLTAPVDRRLLRGDLDAVILKAMSRDPARRYGSAQELSDDLGRVIVLQPVLAREPSVAYVAVTFARRHRGVVVASAVAVVALLGGLIASLWQTRVARIERHRAAQRFEDVRTLANALIFKIHDAVQPLAGSTPVRQLIVAEALRYLEQLGDDAAGDPGLVLELAHAYVKIGTVQGVVSGANLGDREGARLSFQRAIALLEPIVARSDAPHDAALQLGRAYTSLSSVESADGHRDAAAEARRAAAAIAEARLVREPGDDEARRLLGTVYFYDAVAAPAEGKLEAWQRAAAVFDALLAAEPTDPDRQRNAALVCKYIGGQLSSLGRHEEALVQYQRAYELDRERLAANPDHRQTQLDVAIDLGNLGHSHEVAGRLADAAGYYERSAAIRERIADADPKDVYARNRLSFELSRLGTTYSRLGRHVEAVAQLSRAVRASHQLAGLDRDNRLEYAHRLASFGRVLNDANRSMEACSQLRRSRQELDAVLAGGTADVSQTQVRAVTALLDAKPAACR